MSSGHMPDFAAADPLLYWDAADLYERANGRLYRSIEFALPVELDDEQRRDLAVMFAHRLTATEKLPFTMAIHAGKGHNPHCHLLISERQNDSVDRPLNRWFRRYNGKEPIKGGARKTDTLVPKDWLYGTRKAWADMANHALEDAGHDERIDHRTLSAQGISRKPGVHLGPSQHKRLLKGEGLTLDIAADIGVAAVDIGPPAPKPTPVAPTLRPGAPDSKDRVGEPKTSDTGPDRTAQAVKRQASAMNCRHYHVGILNTDTGVLDEYGWDLQQILENLQLLKRKNAQGHNILIRPYYHPLPGLVLVSELRKDAIDRMRADGYEPTVTLETAPDQYQVWVRVGERITKSRRDDLARYLAEQYGGNLDAAGANTYGKLAGFTTGKPAADGLRPFVVVTQSDTSGKVANGAKQLLKITLEARKQRLKSGPAPQRGGPRTG